MKLHHVEIHPHEGRGYRVEHHMEAPNGAKHIVHHPPRGEKEGVEPDDLAEHVEQILREHEDSSYSEPEETSEEAAAQPTLADKHKKTVDHHSGNNPMGVGRKAPNRQY